MKKLILGMVIATVSLSTSARGFNADIDVSIVGNNRIQNCRQSVRVLSEENATLRNQLSSSQSSLAQCQRDGNRNGNRAQVRKLKEDLALANNTITKLENTVDRKNDKIQDLRRDIQDLQDQLNPRQPGFNLAAAVKACGGISSSTYSNNCINSARKYEVNAKRVKACTKISSSYYAAECVEKAGQNQTNARQIEACTKISSSTYASSCVELAGKGKVPADVVEACVASSTSSYSQKECVSQMAN